MKKESIVLICRYLPYIDNINNINCIINAIMTFVVACIVTLSLILLFFKNEFKEVIKIFKRLLKSKRELKRYRNSWAF